MLRDALGVLVLSQPEFPNSPSVPGALVSALGQLAIEVGRGVGPENSPSGRNAVFRTLAERQQLQCKEMCLAGPNHAFRR